MTSCTGFNLRKGNATGFGDRLKLGHGLIQLVGIFGHHLHGNSRLLVTQVTDLPADYSELNGEFFTDVDTLVETFRVE